VPVHDAIGGSAGFRRPGNIISLEPVYSYMKNNLTINFGLPIAVRRNRPQSYTDLEYSKTTGIFRNGDAAFADYAVNVGIQYTFKAKQKTKTEPQFVIPKT
jgi:formylmethanofuran dehydrogenase subunit E-like metal-binding protein